MDVKAAFSKMKSQPGNPVHFFYCEQGQDGKPVLIVDTKAIPPKVKTDTLATAKKKDKTSGLLEMTRDGELNVTPVGATVTSLAKGIQIVARNSNCMPKAINICKAQPEALDGPKSEAPKTEAPKEKVGGHDLEKLGSDQKQLAAEIKNAAPKMTHKDVAPLFKQAVVAVSEAGALVRQKEAAQAAAKLEEASRLLQSAQERAETLKNEGGGTVEGPTPKSTPLGPTTPVPIADDEDEDEAEETSGGGKVGGYDAVKGVYAGKRPKKPDVLKGVDEAGDSLTAHHLYPWNRILKDINDALSSRSPEKMQRLLQFGEHAAASWFLNEVALEPKDRRPEFGDEVNKAAKAICWSPANIFMGPLNTKRGDDPGEKLDRAYAQSGLVTPASGLAEMMSKKGGIGTDDPLTNLLSKNIREAQEGAPRPYNPQEWVDDSDGKRVARKVVPNKEGGGTIPKDQDTAWSPTKQTQTNQPKAPKEVKPKLSTEEIERLRKEAEERQKLKEQQQAQQTDEEEDEGPMNLFNE